MRLWALILCRNTAHFAHRHGAIVTIPQQLAKSSPISLRSTAQAAQLRYDEFMSQRPTHDNRRLSIGGKSRSLQISAAVGTLGQRKAVK
jgi:hypothetical protein